MLVPNGVVHHIETGLSFLSSNLTPFSYLLLEVVVTVAALCDVTTQAVSRRKHKTKRNHSKRGESV